MLTPKFLYRASTLIALSLLLVGCSGLKFPSLDQMITNFGDSLPGIWRLATSASYILGMIFIFRGVYQLKLYGDLRTMMSTQTNFKATLMLFLVGAILIFYQPAYESFLMSSFGTSVQSPLAINTDGSGFGASTRVLLNFVQLVGFISFVRGWIYLAQSSNPSTHATAGKAMTHIIGGVLAMNIQGTADILKATFGIY